MDKTKTNIKMCQKAKKIQEEWHPQVGDIFAESTVSAGYHYESFPYYIHSIYARTDCYDAPLIFLLAGADCPSSNLLYGIEFEKTEKAIWLPRQDQLQEMIKGTHLKKLGRVYRAVVNMELYPSDSMEQLWLVFVMKEKYGKVWNGKDWVKG